MRPFTTRSAPKSRAAPCWAARGLSNPMKTLFGIETMKLKASPRAEGGYTLRGSLPWVSNIGPDSWFAVIAEVCEGPRAGKRLMAVIHGSAAGVKLVSNDHFVALEGTRTYGVQFRYMILTPDHVLADPIDDYILHPARPRGLHPAAVGNGLRYD